MNEILIPPQYDAIDGVRAPCETAEIFGHKPIIRFFEGCLKDQKLHHALLFEGIKGIGKASLAFQLAWNILSRTNGFETPNFSGPLWRQLMQESHSSFLHVTRQLDSATSNFRSVIRVDEIREVSKMLAQTSADGGWRVVIIDSVDDMNRNAANALLKTLEEPPSRVVLMLLSHLPGRLLPTIRSRCLPIKFQPLDENSLGEALERCLISSPFDVHSPQSRKILMKADGSVRNAALLGIYGGIEISDALAELLNGETLDYTKLNQLANALSLKDAVIQFQQFCREALAIVADTARNFSVNNHRARADEWAGLWFKIEGEIADVEAYNLDKKMFINIMVERLFDNFKKLTFKRP